MTDKAIRFKRHYFPLILAGLIFVFPGAVLAAEITPQNVIKLANASRFTYGLNPLAENEDLSNVAKDKLRDMVENAYFAHTSPSGISPWDWFNKENYDYKFAGENLAIDFLTAESQDSAWMKSESHRKNILNPKYENIGVAVGKGNIYDHESIITVQVFGTLAEDKKVFISANKKEEVKGIHVEKVFNLEIINEYTRYFSNLKNLFNSNYLADKSTSGIILIFSGSLTAMPMALVGKGYLILFKKKKKT